MIARALAAAATALALTVAFTATAADPPPRPKRIDSSALDSAIYQEVSKGFSGTVLVGRRGNVSFERSYGDGIGAEARFWIASMAKQFVAAAVLNLVDHESIRLDDPLSKFFPDAPADKRDVTVLELLSHTSGFATADSADGAPNREAAVKAIFAKPSEGSRGKFRYSNDNYQLAVAIVEQITESSYREVARNMWRTADLYYAGFAGDGLVNHVTRTKGPLPDRLKRTSWGGQGVYATAKDLWRWHEALRKGRVIKRASAERMFNGTVPIGEGEAGLGWFSGREEDGTRFQFTRGNEDFGANGLMYFYPDTETLVVILTHAGDAPNGTPWSRAMLAKIRPMIR